MKTLSDSSPIKTITSAEMRALEQGAIDSDCITGLDLMERAGQGVVEAIFEEWPALAEGAHRAVVLCGPGNNGGDGFVVARLLKEAGWVVKTFFCGTLSRLSSDARANYDRWLKIGEIHEMRDEVFHGWPAPDDDVDIVIDAIFGIGLTRPFSSLSHTQMQLNFIQAYYSMRPNLSGGVVSVDVPSGMNADTGEYPGEDCPMDCSVVANLTVTFQYKKPGHVLGEGPRYCGRVVVKDIGL